MGTANDTTCHGRMSAWQGWPDGLPKSTQETLGVQQWLTGTCHHIDLVNHLCAHDLVDPQACVVSRILTFIGSQHHGEGLGSIGVPAQQQTAGLDRDQVD